MLKLFLYGWRGFRGGGAGPSVGDGILLESSGYILMETGDFLLLE